MQRQACIHIWIFVPAREAVKVLRVLRNPKTLLVKKRQVMRTTFGDYRKKIQVEEKKLAASKPALLNNLFI